MISAAELIRVGSSAVSDGGGIPLIGLVARSPFAVAGPVRAVSCPLGDNLAVQVGVTRAQPGEVLLVHVVGEGAPVAVWGEIMTVAALEAGLAGVVVDGAVRDVSATAERGLACFSRDVTPAGPAKAGGGSVDGVIHPCGVRAVTGDWIVADADGVVLIPAGFVDRVAAAAVAKAGREPALIEGLARGETTIGLMGLDASAVAIGFDRPGSD